MDYQMGPNNQNMQPKQNYNKNSGCGVLVIAMICLIIYFVYNVKKGVDEYYDDSDTQENTSELTTEITTEKEIPITTEEKINVTIDEQVIFDEKDIVIKVTGFQNNDVSFYIENNSDINLNFCMHSYAVNGIMTNENIFTMNCNVVSNSKNKCTLEIPDEFLNNNNIDVIKTLTLHIWAYDTDESFKEFDCGTIVVNTSENDNKNNIQSGELLLEENGLKYELIKVDNQTYYIGVTNTSEELFDIDMQNLVINDWTCDIMYDFDLIGLQILPSCQNIIKLDISDYLKEKNIDVIEYISFNFNVRPNADYFKEYNTAEIIINNTKE